MNTTNRRTLLAAAAALGATAAASAQPRNEPVIGDKGAAIVGPHNPERELQNPDILRPPSTDHGSVPNLRFSLADAHMKIRTGGWSREVTQRELAISTTMAGVNMRLTAGGVRDFTGTSKPNGRSCWRARPASQRSTMTATISSPMSVLATSGTFHQASLTRSRACRTTAANSCWRFRTASSPRTARLRSPTCLPTTTPLCWPGTWAST